MGTGMGAAREGASAAKLLEAMLTAGFPPSYALRSLNSLCCLRGQAGAVTMDLAQIRLDSGEVTLYKWGAAPSWILRRSGVEKVGTAGPPPGISLEEARESVQRLSLRRGEALILTSDGVQAEEVLHRLGIDPAEPPGEVASCLLEHGAREGTDDATVAVIRLRSTPLSTS
jgi:stage II sporulation protein E